MCALCFMFVCTVLGQQDGLLVEFQVVLLKISFRSFLIKIHIFLAKFSHAEQHVVIGCPCHCLSLTSAPQ